MAARKVAQGRHVQFREDPAARSARFKLAGERIRQLREHEKMSREAFAETIGTKRRTVELWEEGTNVPGDKFVFAMHKLYHVPLAYLHGVEGAARHEPNVTLTSGETLTDNQLNDALAIRLNGALQARVREKDEAAVLLRRFLARKCAMRTEQLQRRERRVLLSQAIALIVEDTVRLARLSYENKTAWQRLSRIERFTSHQFDRDPELLKRLAKLGSSRLSAELARIAKLGASLVETETEYDQFKSLQVEDAETGRMLKARAQEEANERFKTERRRAHLSAAWAQYQREARKGESS